VKVTFFRGASLRPVPPGGAGKDARWVDIHEDDLDEAQMATWVKQRRGARSGPDVDDDGQGAMNRAGVHDPQMADVQKHTHELD
jgi:hypothetical protein